MGKKIKKFLKKAAKAAIIGGAIYGATKLAKNRKKKAFNATGDKNYGFDKSGSFTGEGLSGSSTVNTPPVNNSKEWRHGRRDKTFPFTPNKTIEETLSGTDTRNYKKRHGNRKNTHSGTGLYNYTPNKTLEETFKKGGRVTGCAKRGFGRALKRK